MNALFEFYLGVKRIMEEAKGEDWLESRDLLEKLPSVRQSSLWKPNEQKIVNLCEVFADPTHRQFESIVCEFLLAAMKDLSVMKNPQAYSLFEELRGVFLGDESLADRWVFIWARKVKKQGKRGKVIVLHTSGLLPKNLEGLRTVIDGGLERGIAAHYIV